MSAIEAAVIASAGRPGHDEQIAQRIVLGLVGAMDDPNDAPHDPTG